MKGQIGIFKILCSNRLPNFPKYKSDVNVAVSVISFATMSTLCNN